MNLMLFGAPGCGKGTVAEILVRGWPLTHFSLGAFLRAEVRADSAIGRQVAPFLAGGILVPDPLVIDCAAAFLRRAPVSGYILDGFPRNFRQAEALVGWLHRGGLRLDAIIHLHAVDAIVTQRMLGRRACTHCGHLFNIYFLPPRVENVCDACGAGLEQRASDTLAVVQERIAEYKSTTAPILPYLSQFVPVHALEATNDRAALERAVTALMPPRRGGPGA